MNETPPTCPHKPCTASNLGTPMREVGPTGSQEATYKIVDGKPETGIHTRKIYQCDVCKRIEIE